jgi:hypothetical protein
MYLMRPAAASKFYMVEQVFTTHYMWIVRARESAVAAVSRFPTKCPHLNLCRAELHCL